jgi:chromosome segregation ATPase
MSNILPGHASVTDAITRLQRERDLALRRVDELHDHYKKELKNQQDADRTMTRWHKDEHQKELRESKNETAQYKMQFENAKSLIETQKLSIKLLQDELGEEAEFDEWFS